ncbi:MAG: 4'-phosphopantetheinyl transferase superfamily protein [Planctomycetales bacterium]|nr:4'-phosphopantetheinyl transferase superfamily protein [Planctomycetales bacterium]
MPAICEANVFVVPLSVNEAQYADYERLLNGEERARADRFLLPELRRRFVACRGRLRSLLAEATASSASELRFVYQQWGKPTLPRPRQRAELHFNVSHSQEWALIALAQSPLGVDFEFAQERLNPRALAAQILSPEERPAWDGLPPSDRALATLPLWVCKEALLKALGLGIAEGLQQVSFPLPLPREGAFAPRAIDASLQLHLEDDGSCRTNHWIDSRAWRVQFLDILPDSHAALCTSAAIRQVNVIRL